MDVPCYTQAFAPGGSLRSGLPSAHARVIVMVPEVNLDQRSAETAEVERRWDCNRDERIG